MAEMTKEQMEKLMKRREETMTKARQSPDFTAAPEEVPLPKDRPKNLKDFVEEVFKEDSSFTRDPFADATEEEKEEAEAELQRQMEEEKKTKKAEGGSVEKKADFVKDDDEEPNDPPPGAKPEEVADDIPAYLSTGEYVLPANVVRYLGLERIVSMHKGALAALQQMEDLDIIENVDENGMVEEDDDEMDYLKQPKGVVKTTLVVAKPHPSGMMAMPFAEGGAPGGPDDTGAAPDEDTFADPGQDDTLGEEDEADPDAIDEMDPEDTGFSPGLGLEDPDPGGYEGGRRQLDPNPLEKFADFFTQPSPKTREQKPVTEEQLKQFMLNNPDLTRQQAKEELEFFNLGRTTPPADVAKSAGLIAGVAQSFFNKLEDAGFTITPSGEYDQRQEDLGLGPDDGSDNRGVITETKLDDDDADDSDGTDDFVFQPGVGFIPRRRFLRRVQTLKEGDLPTARKGGLMGQ